MTRSLGYHGLAALTGGALLLTMAPFARGETSAPVAAPGSAALELLGANDLKVLRPGSVGALLSEGRTLVQDSKLAPGVAIELSPWALTSGRDKSHEWISDNLRIYNLYRSTVSIGNVADPLRAGGVRSAVALRLQLWDETDWRLNDTAIACHQKVVPPASLPSPSDGPPTNTPSPPLTEEQMEAVDRCREKGGRWNASQSALGVGGVFASPDGRVQSLRGDALHGWFGIGWGVGQALGLIASARYIYQSRRTEPGMATPLVTPSSHALGAGFNVSLRSSWIIGSVEGALGWRHQQSDDSIKYAGTAAVQVAVGQGTWFEVRGEYAGVKDRGAFSGSGHLRWNFDPR